MNVYESIQEMIGGTPLVRLSGYGQKRKLKAEILAKLEYLNPAGSVKDRVALYMLMDAEKKGLLKPDTTVIEPTSGNTGIGLAAIAAAKGNRTIIVMPALGMKGAIARANELAADIPNSFIPGQFTNQANPLAHYETTGPEIWKDTDGAVDILVSGVGTGGTLTGAGRYLKERNPDIQVIAVEPKDSPVLSGGRPGAHKLQGIGAGFLPLTLDTAIYDEVIAVSTEEAYDAVRVLAKEDGILAGISAGAALWAAEQVARRSRNRGKSIVVIIPDSGEKYLSGPLFE